MNVYTKKDKVTYWEVSVLKCSAMLLIIISSIQVWAERSSPFNPPTTTDRTFITDVSPGLDTRCTSRNEGPLIVEVKINRYVGEVDDDGYLKNPNALIINNVVSSKARLRMPAWDIDINGGNATTMPEHDKVFINGKPVELLSGDNNVWKMNEFEIDITDLKFPAKGVNGQPPVPVTNIVSVDIDISNTTPVWCMSLD